jgi:NTE family protein
MSHEPTAAAAQQGPVRRIPTDPENPELLNEIVLCLSGGGYRAMLYHVGSLWRLNEVGLLAKLNRISSVSGGSIIAGVLGLHWGKLQFQNGIAKDFVGQVVTPIRTLAQHTIDLKAGWEILNPFKTIAEEIATEYSNYLFKAATLQDLPDTPRFVLNATNVQSKVLWRFSKPYAWDYRVGKIDHPKIPLAVAVGASSAFPPFLSPVILEFKESDFVPNTGMDLQKPPFTTKVFLTDGGVYDNLGLETAWKQFRSILVSDGGGLASDEEKPARDWALHAYRTLELIDNQVRSLRKRELIDAFKRGERAGTYWGIRTDISAYGVESLPCPLAATTTLAQVSTRLASLNDEMQEKLINWGYAVTDAALRAHFAHALAENIGIGTFPYPQTKV